MKKKVLQVLLLGMFAFLSSQAFAQFKVSGVVKSPDGEALPGATVAVKGTTTGVLSDLDGNYTITLPNDQSVLVFSFVGMTTKEVPVNGKSIVNVTLESTSIGVDEVVVTALGISKEKKSLAFSVGEVKADDLVKAGNSNVMKSLDGKVSGVNLTSLSSDPTSSVLVNVRGTTAMPTIGDRDVAKKGQPLYVIDGIPVGRQTFTSKDGVDFGNILSQLSPEDIENITILKGGSAGALYGAEGGNGVIMITTKSGKGGQKGIGVSVSSSLTVDRPYNFIESQDEFGQGERAFEWQYDNGDTWGPKLDGSYSAIMWNVKTQAWETKPQVSSGENRMKAYLQNGSTMNNSVSINGNYDKGAFRLSFSNMSNKGVMPNTKTGQKGITLNSEYKLTEKLKISANANYIMTYSPNKANITGSNSVLNALLFNLPVNYQPLSEMKNYWLTGYEGVLMNGASMKLPATGQPTTVPNGDNPWWTTYENIHRFSRNNFFGKVQLDWQISKHWAAMLRSGMENVEENYELRRSWGKANDFGQFNPSSTVNTDFASDAILTYNNTFGKLSLTAFGGVNYNYSKSFGSDINANDLAVPGLFTVTNAKAGTLTSNYTWGIGRSYSVYGTMSLGYDNQLFVDVTGRNDWKGILDEEKINYFYPSVSASWVASETFKMPEGIDLLKFRLGWADVGNGLTKLRNVDTYSFDANDWGAAKTVNISAVLVDPDIKPMHSITKEAGLDLWLLNKRVQLDFTYFIKDQVDQIDQIPTVQGTGFNGMTTNIGDVRGKGFEGGITVTPVRTQNWNWDVSGTITHYKASITRLSEKFAPNGYVFANYDGKTKIKIAEGEEIGSIYEENPIMKVKTGKYAGMYLLDEDGKFQKSSDERDRGKLGNFNPDYILGINTSLRYKRLTLNLVGSLRVGGEYVSVNQQYLESNGRALTTLGAGPDNPVWVGGRDAAHGGLPWPAVGSSDFEVINDWNAERYSEFNDASYVKGVFINPNFTGTTPTDADYIVNGADPKNTFYDFPYNAYGDAIWNFTSTRTYDATNFKLREVSIAYALPNSLTNKIKMNDIVISLVGRNVLQWNANGRNEDPESAFSGVGTNQGILRATLPSIGSYGFKISANF
ncbi:MAG: SusC/RagA family TonB-linked outer membrane protein [Prolixibacteraceae bacterium]|nr:SusC/RagA family TonB-linked outer membrane protein [Prolixibacteraceae bacterium]